MRKVQGHGRAKETSSKYSMRDGGAQAFSRFADIEEFGQYMAARQQGCAVH